jgi:integrase
MDETRWHPSGWRPSTRRRAVGLLQPILEEGVWTGRRLNDIRPSDVTALLRRQAAPGHNRKSPDRGWSDLTLHHLHALLRVAFRDAVGEELVATNPVRDTPAPKQRTTRPIQVLEPAERQRLIRACLASGDPRLLAVACLAELGMRSGELRALRRKDVALMSDKINIERTTCVTMGHRQVTEEGDTKSRASKRPVEVPSFLYKALQAHMSRGPEGPYEPEELIFESRRGGYLPQSALASALYRGLKLAEIDRFLCTGDRSQAAQTWIFETMPELVLQQYEGAPICPRCQVPHWHLRVHDLRHSALSAWLADKYTPQAVARRAGHSKITLLAIYGHGLEEQDREIARRSQEAWEKGGVISMPPGLIVPRLGGSTHATAPASAGKRSAITPPPAARASRMPSPSGSADWTKVPPRSGR